jgi:hypothetical protein
MNRKYWALLIALFLLVCFGTSASASLKVPGFSVAGGVVSGHAGIAVLRYDITGVGIQTVNMYLMVPNKYLTLTKGTSKYGVLKKNVIVHQRGGDVIIKSGTKYWTRVNPPMNYSPKGPHVFLALKVARNIPRGGKQCIRINATGYTMGVGDIPAVSKFDPAGGGYCMSGKKWLNSAK